MERYLQIGDLMIGKGNRIVFSTLSGFESGEVQKQTNRFLNVDGAQFCNMTFDPRSIEIQGHILARSREELEDLKKKLSMACYPKEKQLLQYFDGIHRYRAWVQGASLPEYGARKGQSYFVPFVSYLLIPGFFWEDGMITEISVGMRENRILSTFTLPCTFTDRTLECEYENRTGIPIYPVIRIRNVSGSSLSVQNVTTGERIDSLDEILDETEEIIIDCENYTIANAAGENVIDHFSDFENWCLSPGINRIQVLSDSGSFAVLQFREKYLGV